MKSMKIEDGKIKIRARGVFVALLGLPILVVGCGLTVASILGNAEIEFLPMIAGVFVMLLLVAGGLLLSIRVRLEVDADSRAYRQRLGLFALTKEVTGSLDEFDKVTLDREVCARRSEHGRRPYTVYPIRLAGPAKRLDLVVRRKLAGARNEAEQVAKTLGLPLADRSGSEETVREAAHLDEALASAVSGPVRVPGKFPRGLRE